MAGAAAPAADRKRRPAVAGWAPYLVLAVVLVVTFALAGGSQGPRTRDSRVRHLASLVRCPTCEGLSAQESSAEAARSVRDRIAREVDTGRSDGQILAGLRDTFGGDIILTPSGTGLSGLVWALPVIALVCAVAGLVVTFRRWKIRPTRGPSAEDRELVAAALRTMLPTSSEAGGR